MHRALFYFLLLFFTSLYATEYSNPAANTHLQNQNILPEHNTSKNSTSLVPINNTENPKKDFNNQYETNPKEDDLDNNKKIWNLRNADIRAVIGEIAQVTGKNFVIDPRVQGKISIVSGTPISDRALYQVFLSMLQVSGYAAVPTGEVIKIIPNIDARSQSADFLNQLRNPPHGEDMMVQVIPVHHVPADQLIPTIRPLMPQWSSVSAYAPSNMIILSGRANNIKQMVNIIRQVDSSSANDIDIVPLNHALAMDIANTLKDLIKNQGQMGQQMPTTLVADDKNNSIIISGTKTERIKLRLLINKLDKKDSFGANSTTQVVYLNYLRAEDLVPILAGIAQANFSGTVGTTIGTITRPELDSTNPAASIIEAASAEQSGSVTYTPSAQMAPNTTSAQIQNEGGTKPTVQIIAEANTNSIILNAPVTLIRTLKQVISKLDIKPAQILVEALVAEINESDFNNLGIEWGALQGKEGKKDKSGFFRQGFAIINSQIAIDKFQAQIYALERLRKANILSTPAVVVLDNRQAKILIGKQVSIASTSYPNNAAGQTTASPFTTFDRINVALHLYVRPQITRGNGIQMQIDQGNDTLDASSFIEAASTTPIFNISAIVTSVHVESGNVIVLGGLTQDSLGNDNSALPIIGQIPGLGRLFQRNTVNREKKVLMVFIRPIILKTEDNNMQISGSKYFDVRQSQLDFLRNQEEFAKRNKDTVLPPLQTAILPKPFCPEILKPSKSLEK